MRWRGGARIACSWPFRVSKGHQGTSAGGREAGSMRRQEISRDVDFGARVRRHERVHKNMMMHG